MPRYPTRTAAAALTSDGGVTAVDRALRILTAFRDGDRALTLSQIGERCDLVPSTTLRLLASLQHFRFVQRTEHGLYALGPAVAWLHRLYAASFSLEAVVPPALRRLVDSSRESASFHVRQGDLRLVLYRVDSPQALSDQSRAGDLLPLDRGAGGHLLMAFAGAKGRRFEQIRRQGFAATPVSDRTPDLSGISAPVFDGRRELVGAVTLIMPSQRYDPGHIPLVKAEAARVTRELGGADSPT